MINEEYEDYNYDTEYGSRITLNDMEKKLKQNEEINEEIESNDYDNYDTNGIMKINNNKISKETNDISKTYIKS
jgi:hypothetical protein